jgi:hypothetical protein
MRRKDDAWLDGVISSDVTDVDFSLGGESGFLVAPLLGMTIMTAFSE